MADSTNTTNTKDTTTTTKKTVTETTTPKVETKVAPEVKVVEKSVPAPTPVKQPDPVVVQPTVVTVTGDNTKTAIMVDTIKDTMASYLNAMAPGKPMPVKTGAANQYTLYKMLSNVCNMVDGFNVCWNELLKIFNENKKGALAERYVFRFAEELPGTKEEHEAFFRLLNLLILTADPETRKENLKQVSLYKTTQDGFTETARNNINQFYK